MTERCRPPVRDRRDPRACARSCAIGVLCLVGAGCGSGGGGRGGQSDPIVQPSTLTDTTGASFSWHCTNGKDCATTALPGAPPSRPSHMLSGVPGYTYNFGRIGAVCDAWIGGNPLAQHDITDCRPVVCAVNTDCPQWWFEFGEGFVCKNGLCQAPWRLDDVALWILCLAEEPRSGTKRLDPLRWSEIDGLVDKGCTNPDADCNVPAECRQP